jgi:hypothetical protein
METLLRELERVKSIELSMSRLVDITIVRQGCNMDARLILEALFLETVAL